MSPSVRQVIRMPAVGLLFAVVAIGVALGASPREAGADAVSYVPVTGAGSTWSENAIDQWISDVQKVGMRINYQGVGSTAGREDFLDGTVDFAATDIPFQTKPDDGSAPENPVPGTYAYIPITAGGTVFMYNLTIDGQRVTNLRLSGENIAKIFTGEIKNWDSPAIEADNPDLQLPNEPIVPVVRSDGAGDSYEFSQWMISQFPSIWNSFCSAAGRAPACGPTSFYPTLPGMIAQSGDLGVSGYVDQGYAAGAIGYVNYSYAIDTGFPVAQMLNAAGYYTEPTPQNVAVSLLQAQVETADTDPSVYLTEKLQNVYTDPDPRTYPLSSYSYMIVPIKVQGDFNNAKGATLAAFANYAMCAGQSDISILGYSPIPANLVEDSFSQIAKIPGAGPENTNIQSCNNPTFSTATGFDVNLLADTAPQPPACDKQGSTQCTTGTGGAQSVATPISAPAKLATVAAAGASDVTSATGTAADGGAVESSSGPCSDCQRGTGAGATSESRSLAYSADTDPIVNPVVLGVTRGWSSAQTLLVVVVLGLIVVIFVPALMARARLRRRVR